MYVRCAQIDFEGAGLWQSERTSECSLLLLRNSSAYFGIRAAPALCAEPSRIEERAAAPDDEALRALEIWDMGAVTRDMVRVF